MSIIRNSYWNPHKDKKGKLKISYWNSVANFLWTKQLFHERIIKEIVFGYSERMQKLKTQEFPYSYGYTSLKNPRRVNDKPTFALQIGCGVNIAKSVSVLGPVSVKLNPKSVELDIAIKLYSVENLMLKTKFNAFSCPVRTASSIHSSLLSLMEEHRGAIKLSKYDL